MEFEELQRTWQSQEDEPMIGMHLDTLLKLVERNRRTFEGLVFWRDVREVGVAIVMAVLFAYWGIKGWPWGEGWPWFVLVGLVMWVGVFMVVDRFLQKRKMPAFAEPLRACLQRSLNQVNHQIWLLKNVLWWYILPLAVGCVFVTFYLVWPLHELPWDFLKALLRPFVLYGVISGGVYWLNQWAVRKELLPRKQELEALLDSLNASED